ncbi:syntaxin-19 [Gadus chalcogrammus]|uniref:syntaxin-19 n=1 Tax=Gadus chalcogrammus TaxID=1042646 RepID=UPI0024C4ACB6|nr:syntaxin-19 [Gadus chalcogrammus]XP_056436211.1 syntaxin-19 [Gadus chalcogrammus]XP_056436212.1 syntaxin-19 [Gadus chalcogrammus]XP_056436213.1 syntaxin-19 [Gadus chalcogrammus]
MRDRLDELRQKAQEDPDLEAEIIYDPLSGVNEPDDPTEVDFTTPRAVVFEEEPVIENFLCEAQRIRDEITELDADVVKFSQQQKTLVATMRRFSVMKKESSITRDIKLQAEGLHKRLNALSKEAQKTEGQHGPTAAVSRIQRTQHAALLRQFQKVMSNYNTGLLTKQERCRHFIIRQLEVSGREVTEEEVNDMVATGKWEVFNENMLNDARITRSQLSEIEQRHKELLNLENNMVELRDLFTDIYLLVEEQGAQIDHIQTNVERTADYVAVSNEKFKLAARYKRKNPLRQLCCCCCPPWRCCF